MSEVGAKDGKKQDMLGLASEIVAAYVSKNPVPAGDLSTLIKNVHAALCGLAGGVGGIHGTTNQKPVVPIKRSVTNDYIICLEDGKKLKMLKRYLRSKYNLSPDEYRTKWNLPREYPMVAPNYAARRSEFAKQMGLGRSKSVAAPKRRTTRR